MEASKDCCVLDVFKGKRILSFPLFDSLGLSNVFSTSDMDFRLREGTSVDEIRSHYLILKEYIGAKDKLLYSSNQVHDCNVIKIDSLEQGEVYAHGRELPPVDGLVTSRNDVILKTVFADCTPILIYDPVKRVHSSVHSGWRGTSKSIARVAIEMMISEYGSKAEDILVSIGPAISKDSFEVLEDVVKIFCDSFDFASSFIRRKDEVKFLVDIKGINREICLSLGVPSKNIFVCDMDTYGNSLFHSHRFQGEAKAGRMVMVSSLKV